MFTTYHLRMIAAVLLAAAPAGFAAEYKNPKFTIANHPIRQVLILPADFQAVKSGLKGGESITQVGEDAGQLITDLLVEQLQKVKVTVMPNPFTSEALRQNDDLQSALTRLQGKYNTISGQLHSKPGDVRKGRFTLGDEVSTLGPAAGADTLVFVRGTGSVPTVGKKAFNVLVTHIPAYTTLQLYVAFVDARSGDVFAMIYLHRAADFRKKDDPVLTRAIADSFKKLPISN